MKRPGPWRLSWVLVVVAASWGIAGAQENTRRPPIPADSALAAVRSDTTKAVTDTVLIPASPSGIDSVITYAAADSVIYSLGDKTMYLFGNGSLQYKELGLKAEKIDINWNTSLLFAEGVPDTADTTGKKFRGQPVMIDGNETYDGSTLTYNFKSKKGKIDVGKTEIEKGLYYGDAIKKANTDVLYVENGRFTTCELDHPHYYFGSPEMKVIVKERVVARPVYLYISDVPVFALPFGIFPSERGRRSGLIMPAYGQSSRGRYLTHLGYYWAINDYMDWSVKSDLYSKGSYTAYSDFRYALRYNFVGAISASVGRAITGESGDPNYGTDRVFNIRLNHSQEFDPTARLLVDFTFTSGSYYQQTSYNLNDLLRQNVVSNATLTKYWEGTPNSLTLNVRRDQNLAPTPNSVEISDILPSVVFSRSQSFPFRSSKKGASAMPEHWYDYIGYSYAGSFLNTRTKTRLTEGSSTDERAGVQHSLALNAAPKAGYITIAPFFNYTEKWYNKRDFQNFNPADSSLIPSTEKGFYAVRYFDLGVSASTKIYGIFQPGIFGIKGIRHQLTPSISYVYQPDFSKPGFGYFGTYVDQYGTTQQYGLFDRSVFGGAPAGERQSINLNVGNVFEMKTATVDTSAQENKFQLLNLNLGIGYNFAADSLRFTELGLDFRTNVAQLLSIGGGARFNLYKFAVDPRDSRIGRRVNEFLLKDGRLADMTSFSISVGTHLSGQKTKSTAGPSRTAADSLGQKRPRTGMSGLYSDEDPDFSIPWNLDLMWNFSQNQSDPRTVIRSSSLVIGLSFNLTELWKITTSSSYDILNRQISAPQISVYRDLHCWEMNFTWVPTGLYRNFRLEIRLKAPQLQDVKVTKQGSASGIY
jgi:lipopolysaccharide assembly outer membrane protein LptD (OstA)